MCAGYIAFSPAPAQHTTKVRKHHVTVLLLRIMLRDVGSLTSTAQLTCNRARL